MSLEYTDCALQSVWWLCIPTTASCNLHAGFVKTHCNMSLPCTVHIRRIQCVSTIGCVRTARQQSVLLLFTGLLRRPFSQ